MKSLGPGRGGGGERDINKISKQLDIFMFRILFLVTVPLLSQNPLDLVGRRGRETRYCLSYCSNGCRSTRLWKGFDLHALFISTRPKHRSYKSTREVDKHPYLTVNKLLFLVAYTRLSLCWSVITSFLSLCLYFFA